MNNANYVFGANVNSLKGKTTRKSFNPLVTEYMEVPQLILYLNKKVTLAADVMFFNGLALFVSTSWSIKFTTLEYTPKCTKIRLISSLNKVISIYNASGFNIKTVLMVREFDCMIPYFLSIKINPTATSEHVPEIERQIRVIKERARSIRSKTPFTRTPKRVIIELLKFVVMWLNDLPVKSGVSYTFRPRTIMNGTTLD